MFGVQVIKPFTSFKKTRAIVQVQYMCTCTVVCIRTELLVLCNVRRIRTDHNFATNQFLNPGFTTLVVPNANAGGPTTVPLTTLKIHT